MTANHHSWRRLADAINERMQELGIDAEDLRFAIGFPSRTHTTSILCGRARLQFRYVGPLARALRMDEGLLFRTTLEGTIQSEDSLYLMEFLDRLSATNKKKRKKRKRK